MRRITGMATLLCAGLLLLAACAGEPSAPVPIARDMRAVLDVSGDQGLFGAAEITTAQAAHLEGFPCFLGPAGLTFDSKVTISSSGNATLTCKGETPVGPPETLVLKGFLCGVPLAAPPFFATTTDTHFVWTKSGQASLVCHVKANN